VHDAEANSVQLQRLLDEQRQARIQEEVRNAKLLKQLKRARAQASLVEGVAVYSASLRKELVHLNAASDQTFEFSAVARERDPSSSPENSVAGLGSAGVSTPTAGDAALRSMSTPHSAAGAGSGRAHSGMSRSRIVISSASKPKERAPSAPRASPPKSPKAAQRTFFETDSDGDY